ncbi:MAG: response regulator [bacterium]
MPKRLLLVDDDTSIFMAYRKLMQSLDLKVDTASTIEDSKALLEKYRYAFVITDLRLSGVKNEEGFEIVKIVKDHYPETKVILVTAYGDPEIKEKAYALGVSHYFEKPVSVNVLKKAMISFGFEDTANDLCCGSCPN